MVVPVFAFTGAGMVAAAMNFGELGMFLIGIAAGFLLEMVFCTWIDAQRPPAAQEKARH